MEEDWSSLRIHGGMLAGGIVCGIMLWLALSLAAGGNLNLMDFIGAILGGAISGFIMDMLG
jgi:hypothetical protein